MKIIDIDDKYKQVYFLCLEEWSPDMKDAGNHKELWYNKMKDKGLRVKLALDDRGEVGGMIQYIPIEYSAAEGKGLYFINCIWVHGHKQGRGNFQKKGMGKALIQAAENDARGRGAKGIVAWGLALPFWMRASWFKRQGYSVADKIGMQILLWKPFTGDAVPPKWIKMKRKPQGSAGKVMVTAFINGWCPAQNIVFERAQRASKELGDKVEFCAVNTLDRKALLEWGIEGGLFIDDKQVRTGPPPPYEKIKSLIERKAKRVRR